MAKKSPTKAKSPAKAGSNSPTKKSPTAKSVKTARSELAKSPTTKTGKTDKTDLVKSPTSKTNVTKPSSAKSKTKPLSAKSKSKASPGKSKGNGRPKSSKSKSNKADRENEENDEENKNDLEDEESKTISKEVEIRAVFDLIDEDNSGELSMQEIRKALRRDRKVIKFIKKTPSLRPLLEPRFFHDAIKQMDLDSDGSISFAEFYTFCLAVGQRQTLDEQSIELFAIMQEERKESEPLYYDNLPYALYTCDKTLSYLREKENLWLDELEQGVLPSKSQFPIAVMLKPLTVYRGVHEYRKNNEVEGVVRSPAVSELDFRCIASSVLHMRIGEFSSQAPQEELEAIRRRNLPHAETFSEMAHVTANKQDAITYLEQSINLLPEDKVYRVALAERLLHKYDFPGCAQHAEIALQVTERFWPHALELFVIARQAQENLVRIQAENAAARAAAEANARQNSAKSSRPGTGQGGNPRDDEEDEDDSEDEDEDEDVDEDEDEDDESDDE